MVQRNGFTLIESLVTLGIISALLALILPAVQAARVASWRNHCASNLRQIGISISAYESAFGYFPSAHSADNFRGGLRGGNYFSPFSRLLPYLEADVANAANFEVGSIGYESLSALATSDHGTAANLKVSAYVCPADSASFPTKGNINYRVCLGAEPYHFPDDEKNRGAFEMLRWIRPSDITDGLAKTVGISERLLGSGVNHSFVYTRDVWYTNAYNLYGGLPPVDILESLCNSLPPAGIRSFGFSGGTWLISGFENTFFTSAVQPNASVSDCSAEDFDDPPFTNGGLMPARSTHGPVNALLMDGSVSSFGQDVDRTIWQAYATRAGGESSQ